MLLTPFFEKFRLKSEKEELPVVIEYISNGVVFRGTNLWILIFAIFVASLGLNVNATAVIIGAMLISPLMGPIMGIGLGIGINDLSLLRKAFYNYSIATGVALATSTLFFLLSPLDDAHSEILARTSPNIYDVLIALFGGFAGILATSSKQKGNVIPGVAIATALMPPLCTAGYGLATLQLRFFMGAFYLFIINTVFIALSTFIFVRLLHFPYKQLQNRRAEVISQRIVWLVTVITLLPSLYFGYDMVKQSRFTRNANNFINYEAIFPNDYLLNKKIDARDKSITLVFGGNEISASEIEKLKGQLKKYDLQDATLEVNQGFAYLADNKTTDPNDQVSQLTIALEAKEREKSSLQAKLDSLNQQQNISKQLFSELKSLYPGLKDAVLQPSFILGDSARSSPTYLAILSMNGKISSQDKTKIQNWLNTRLQLKVADLIIR